MNTLSTRYWGFGATVGWSILIAAIYTTAQIAFIIFTAFQNPDVQSMAHDEFQNYIYDLSQDGNVFVRFEFLATILCVAAMAGIIKLKKGATIKEYMCLNHVPMKTVAKWIAAMIGLIIVYDLLMVVLQKPIVPEFETQMLNTVQPLILFVVAVGVLAPILEEAFFRGFIFKGLETSFVGPIGTIVITAICWSVLHMQYEIWYLLAIFAYGLVLGAARHYTRSLYLPVAMHAVSNLWSMTEAVILR